MTRSSLLAAARGHRILSAVLITGVILAALEIPYLVLARSDRPLRTLSEVSAPRRENRPAPSFVVPRLDGLGTIAVGRSGASVTVLNFWASWCTACRAEASDLEGLWRGAPRGVRFIGVDEGDRRDAALSFQKELGITYPSGFDPRDRIASRYGILATEAADAMMP